jgi:hypothetical protein
MQPGERHVRLYRCLESSSGKPNRGRSSSPVSSARGSNNSISFSTERWRRSFSTAVVPVVRSACRVTGRTRDLFGGFVARPVGGLICGHLGDRFGRKPTLVMALIMMGVATTVIGCLPTYADVGIWAPIALTILRFVQGFAFRRRTGRRDPVCRRARACIAQREPGGELWGIRGRI